MSERVAMPPMWDEPFGGLRFAYRWVDGPDDLAASTQYVRHSRAPVIAACASNEAFDAAWRLLSGEG